jgi:hypothetical protein
MEESVLLQSFREYEGLRGAHLYGPDGCKFLTWGEVVRLVNNLPENFSTEFEDKLMGLLSNYDPDYQFLALKRGGEGSISIELYEKNNVD